MIDDIISKNLETIKGTVKKDSFEKKKVLVTGGAGFIGSWLCDVLVGFGAERPSQKSAEDYYYQSEVRVKEEQYVCCRCWCSIRKCLQGFGLKVGKKKTVEKCLLLLFLVEWLLKKWLSSLSERKRTCFFREKPRSSSK